MVEHAYAIGGKLIQMNIGKHLKSLEITYNAGLAVITFHAFSFTKLKRRTFPI